MKNRAILLVIILFLVWIVSTAGAETVVVEESLPNLELPIPDSEKHRNYLGLTGKSGETFVLTDIQADILLIELFSMYCPFCQKEAPLVNDFYEKVEEANKHGPVIKIIGLGASNSQFEVEHFRDTYQVPFPLFPDKDMSKYRALGGAGTPTFIGCRLSKDGKATIVLRNSGGFDNAEDFLVELIASSCQE